MSGIKNRAIELYEPPFTFQHGYIYDANSKMVADKAGSDALTRIRGWGRIGSLSEPERLQDAVGELIAELLTMHWPESTANKEPSDD